MADSNVDDRPICAQCGARGSQTPPVAVVLVFLEQMPEGYPLIPSAPYPLCEAEGRRGEPCESIMVFIESAIRAHVETSRAGEWSAAVICFGSATRLPWLVKRPLAHALARA